MNKTLKEKTAHAISWVLVDRFGQLSLNLVISIVLARYFLSPSDYGIVGMVAILNALGGMLIDSGFSNALIRKQSVTQVELSSVFYFNVLIGLLLYFIMFISAPLISAFYQYPILTPIIRVITLGVPLSSLVLIQTVTLTKQHKFRMLTQANLVSFLSSGVLCLFLAWKGYGVWVLVIQPLACTLIRNIYLWSATSWRPSACFNFSCIAALWKYSSKLLLASSLNVVYSNMYTLSIGKIFPISQVGYYTQANKYSEIPYTILGSAVQSATLPTIVAVASEKERLKNAFRKILRVNAFISCPVFLGLLVTAQSLIFLLIGEMWLPIVPYIQVLCVGYLFQTFGNQSANILYTKGLSAQALYLNIVRALLHFVNVICLFRFGMLALIYGWSIVSTLYTLIIFMYTGKQIGYSFLSQLKDILPYLTIAFVMAIGLYLLSLYITNSYILLFSQIPIGITFYLGSTYLLGSKIFREALSILRINHTKKNN